MDMGSRGDVDLHIGVVPGEGLATYVGVPQDIVEPSSSSLLPVSGKKRGSVLTYS
jgi:hypothetical protein